MCSDPDTVGGGVSMAKTRLARARPVEAVGARRPPTGPTIWPRGPRARACRARSAAAAARARAGALGVVRSSRCSSMVAVTVPGCCASTTPRRAPSGPSSCASPAGCRCTCAGRPSTTSPTSATAASPWSSTSCAATSSSRGLEVRYVSNITDIDDKIIARAAEEGRTEAEVAPRVRGGVVGGHGRPRGEAADRRPPRHRLRRADMVGAGRRPRGPGRRLRDLRRRLPVGRPGRRLRPAGPPEPRLAAVRGPGRGRRGEALAPRLRAVEEGQARASRPGRRPGGRAARAGTPSAWSCRSTSWARASTSTAGGIDLAFPHHENERAQAVGSAGAFARHWVHNGWVMVEGEKMSKSLGNFTSLTDLLARADARAYRLLVLRGPLPLAHRGDPGHRGPGRGGPGPPRRPGPPLRPGGTAWPAPPPTRRWPPGPMPAPWRRSSSTWTTTSTPPAPWPGSSTWPGGPTRPPTPGDAEEGRRLGPHRGGAVRRLGLAPRRVRPRTDDAETAALVAERDRARAAGTTPAPTPSGAELEAGAGSSRTAPTGTRLHRRPGS